MQFLIDVDFAEIIDNFPECDDDHQKQPPFDVILKDALENMNIHVASVKPFTEIAQVALPLVKTND